MKLLIGNTGLIGKTLKDNIKFDYEFNSKNINDLLTIEEDFSNADLYLCCLPATKWLINKNPQADLDNIFGILDIITKKEYRNIILYSTIDVYSDVPLQSDESYPLQVNSPSYGSNRLLFEKLVASTLKYSKLLILRLPALFGKHLKKNILFDLINNNEIHKINYNSKYQWYNWPTILNIRC
jgi:nucleoside-diphosphate-sugar epimerase